MIRGALLLLMASGFVSVQGQDGPMVPPAGGDDLVWEEVIEAYWDYFAHPTEPVQLERLIMPWEPAQAVVLALPVSDWESDPEVRDVFVSMLRALLPRTRVIALHHERDYRLLGDVMLYLEKDPQIAPHKENLEFLSSGIFSIWARDFTPVFGIGKEGQLVAVDSSFIPVRRMMNVFHEAKSQYDPVEQYYSLVEGTKELKGLYGSDRVASTLVSSLKTRYGLPVVLSRAPIYLLGGDFLPLDGDAALVSAITLEENGGRIREMDDALRDYFGIQKVVYLENLPGDTIEHLDFISLPIADKVILTAEAPDISSDRIYHRHIASELEGRLERNRRRLEEAFPDHRIVRVPMLPPVMDSREDVLDELFLHCVTTVAGARGYPFNPDPPTGDPLDPLVMEPQTLQGIKADLGMQNWQSSRERIRAIELVLKRPVEDLINRHVEEHVQYRTYVNCLYLDTGVGEMLLVPRYRPLTAGEADLIRETESRVEALYRELFPDTELHWIDCTELTPLLGAVHCLTATVPQ